MGRKRCTLGKGLVVSGIVILLLYFCSFKFIVTSLAIISIIVGTKILLCS